LSSEWLFFGIPVLCTLIVLIYIGVKGSAFTHKWTEFLQKNNFVACEEETERLTEIVNAFAASPDETRKYTIFEPRKICRGENKYFAYMKVRSVYTWSGTDWYEILFPLNRSNENPVTVFFNNYSFREKIRIPRGRRLPIEFVRDPDVKLDIPRDIEKGNIRDVYGHEGDSFYRLIDSSCVNTILKLRKHGAYAFQAVRDCGMICFDPSCVDLNLDEIWNCAVALAESNSF
jgi:hypothetical protein